MKKLIIILILIFPVNALATEDVSKSIFKQIIYLDEIKIIKHFISSKSLTFLKRKIKTNKKRTFNFKISYNSYGFKFKKVF